MVDNPAYKGLEEQYFQGEKIYNYGGFIPEILIQPPSPSPTPSITPTFTPTNTPTITLTNTSTSTPTPTPTFTPTNTQTNTPTPSITPSPSGSSFDVDAAAYLDDVILAGGTGITPTISAATNTLFTSLKSAGLFTKMISMYPILGGVAASHSLNGIRDNYIYDMTLFGTWTHNSLGMKGNGSNTYAIFNISGGTLPATNSHIACYGNLANNNTAGYDLSINFNNQSGRVQSIILEFNNGGVGYYEYSGYAAVAGADTGDFVIVSRNAAGTQTIRARDGIALSNKTEACNDIDNTRQWFLGAEQGNNGAKLSSTSNRYCWVGFGTKLTDAELLSYQSIVNTFQTTLGRNTY